MEEGAKDNKQTETLSDLEDLFQPDDGTGECLTDKMARITKQALRGKKSKKDEKLKGLREKYKRPKNIENLQAPTVDEFAWRQMKREVKRVDYALKKGVLDCAQAITPLAKALEVMQGNSDPVTAKGYVMDAFKILCLTVKSTNIRRQELIKREMQPKYRDLCAEQPSATKLLGDNFLESVKKLDGTKTQLTMTSQIFLGKRGGGGRLTPVVPPLLQQQQQQQLSEEFQSGSSGRKIPAKPKGKVPLQQQQKPEIKKSSLDEKINAVGIIHSDPFIPLEVPQHIANQEINKRIYDSFKLKNTPENSIAGKTKCFKHNWFKITSDSYIRKTICGYKLEIEDIPIPKVIPKPIKFSHEEQEQINKEIDRFLECGIIEKVNEINEGEFISNIFFRPKKMEKYELFST